MADTKSRRSTLMLFLDLLRDTFIFVNLEVNLAMAEVRRNIRSTKKGALQVAIGASLLLLGLLTLTCAVVAALATVLPLWLSALIVALLLVVSGLLFLVAGKNRVSNSPPIPKESLERVLTVSRKLMEK